MMREEFCSYESSCLYEQHWHYATRRIYKCTFVNSLLSICQLMNFIKRQWQFSITCCYTEIRLSIQNLRISSSVIGGKEASEKFQTSFKSQSVTSIIVKLTIRVVHSFFQVSLKHFITFYYCLLLAFAINIFSTASINIFATASEHCTSIR